MKLGKKILVMMAVLLMASSAQAGLIITSLNMSVGHSTYAVDSGSTFSQALAEFGLAMGNDPICSLSVDIFDNIGGKQLCGGPARNTVTAFSISGYNSGNTEIQFGLDWGRGGFVDILFDGAPPLITKYTDDIWWGRNWRNGDVLSFNFNTTGAFNMLLLGFEGCCNGVNSARWRSAGGDWQTLSVVPVPSVLSLFTLGLVGFGLIRARGTGASNPL